MQPVVGGGRSAALRQAGLDPTLVRRRPISAFPAVHDTLVVRIEPARTAVPFTLTITEPAQLVATGTPAACRAGVADGAQSAAAQVRARSTRRMRVSLPCRERGNTSSLSS